MSEPSLRLRRTVRVVLWAFVILTAVYEVVFLMDPRTSAPQPLAALSPPFGPSSLFLGGQEEQRAISVELVDAEGNAERIDLDDYFHYRLWHRPEVSLPERSQALLRSEPTGPHRRLLGVVAREYQRRHPDRPLSLGRVYLHRWDFPDGSRDERILVIEQELAE